MLRWPLVDVTLSKSYQMLLVEVFQGAFRHVLRLFFQRVLWLGFYVYSHVEIVSIKSCESSMFDFCVSGFKLLGVS